MRGAGALRWLLETRGQPGRWSGWVKRGAAWRGREGKATPKVCAKRPRHTTSLGILSFFPFKLACTESSAWLPPAPLPANFGDLPNKPRAVEGSREVKEA